MNSKHPLHLSLIFPCYKCYDFIIKALNSLKQQSYNHFEIIIINNTHDKKIGEIQNLNLPFSKITIHNSDINLGYAKAVNLGAKLSTYDHLVILNADLTFKTDFIEKIAQGIKSHQQNIFSIHIKTQTESTESKGLYIDKMIRAHNAKSDKKAIGPQGAAFVINKNIIQKIKSEFGQIFDERYFFLWEDVELALRIKKRNIPFTFLANAICYHASNSTKSSYHYKQYLSLRNRFYLIQDYFPNYFITHFLVILMYDIPRICFFLIFNPHRRLLFKDLF